MINPPGTGSNKYKIITLGEAGTGKTSIILRYTRNTFNNNISTTIGANYVTCPIHHNGQLIELELWDTAGQERYRSILPLYTQNSSGILLVFDISSSQPLQYIHHWLEYIKENVSKKIPIFLVGNKYDLLYEQVDFPELTEFAKSNELEIFFTSAKTGENIDILFKTVIDDVVQLENRTLEFTNSEVVAQQNHQKNACCL